MMPPASQLAFPAWFPYQLSTVEGTGGEQGARQLDLSARNVPDSDRKVR